MIWPACFPGSLSVYFPGVAHCLLFLSTEKTLLGIIGTRKRFITQVANAVCRLHKLKNVFFSMKVIWFFFFFCASSSSIHLLLPLHLENFLFFRAVYACNLIRPIFGRRASLTCLIGVAGRFSRGQRRWAPASSPSDTAGKCYQERYPRHLQDGRQLWRCACGTTQTTA